MLNRELKGKWYYALLAGILLGLAALTRSVSKMYLLLVVPFWLLQTHNIKRTVRFTVLALVGFSLLVVPWMIRNHDAVGSATINTNTGINFFIGNQPGSGMGYNQYAADEYDVNDPLREAYVDSAAWHRAWDYIFEKPGAFLARGVMKVGLFYAIDFDPLDYGLHQAANESKTNYYVLLAFLTEVYYLVILLFALLGFFAVYIFQPLLRGPGGYLLWVTILYWTVLHFFFYGMGRYHFPIIPMIAAFAALFIVSRIDGLKKGRFPR